MQNYMSLLEIMVLLGKVMFDIKNNTIINMIPSKKYIKQFHTLKFVKGTNDGNCHICFHLSY